MQTYKWYFYSKPTLGAELARFCKAKFTKAAEYTYETFKGLTYAGKT